MDVIRSDTYSRRLRGWLDRVGLLDDPFGLYEAERECLETEEGTPILSLLFVDRPYLYQMLGNTSRPQAAFLIAGRGCGKTATRSMIAYQGQYGQLRRRVLIVDYTDFGVLLDQVDRDISRIESGHHVRAVLRFALKAVVQQIPSDRWAVLPPGKQQLLISLADEFADPITQMGIASVVKAESLGLQWDRMKPVEILHVLSDLVELMGREAIYVLVDRVDEVAETAHNPGAVADMLHSLIIEPSVLEAKNIAFKFFLPSQVGDRIYDVVRKDRFVWCPVEWDKESLTKLVQRRLRYFSNEYVFDLQVLCESDAGSSVMNRLIGECGGSPRTLLRLCNHLIHHHVAKSDSLQITNTDITDTLLEFADQAHQEHEQTASSPSPASVHTPASSAKALYLDPRKHVWVDGVKLEVQPSPKELKLLEELYYRGGEPVPNQKLIQAIWGASPEGQDETNLRKLISRLREKLDPDPEHGKTRFIRNARGRGYWLEN